MKHLLTAKNNVNNDYLRVEGNMLTALIQDGPIKEVGVNGCQVTDVLEYITEVYKSLNKEFPCRENSLTITYLEEALVMQAARTKDRIERKVEGKNEL